MPLTCEAILYNIGFHLLFKMRTSWDTKSWTRKLKFSHNQHLVTVNIFKEKSSLDPFWLWTSLWGHPSLLHFTFYLSFFLSLLSLVFLLPTHTYTFLTSGTFLLTFDSKKTNRTHVFLFIKLVFFLVTFFL